MRNEEQRKRKGKKKVNRRKQLEGEKKRPGWKNGRRKNKEGRKGRKRRKGRNVVRRVNVSQREATRISMDSRIFPINNHDSVISLFSSSYITKYLFAQLH